MGPWMAPEDLEAGGADAKVPVGWLEDGRAGRGKVGRVGLGPAGLLRWLLEALEEGRFTAVRAI